MNKYQEDIEFIKTAVYNDPRKILLFRPKYLTDDVWELALDQDAALFKYIKNPSTRLCNYALDLDGNNLQYIPEDRITGKMIAIATRSNERGASPYIPTKFIDEEHDTDFYSNFEDDTKDKEVMYREMVRNKPNSIKDIPNPTEDLICYALTLNPMVYLYFSEHTDRMKQVIEEYHPEVTPLLPGFDEE